ncbi:MAG: chemotaxis response regulator protein-glutamate methylesterase [Alphaproteobacteria bacterium]|nr:chemotaxis response regulator protein-glutamate methylesterase [Alphaproteobacteria bacterium]
MVVDDSAVIRGVLTRTLEGDPDITVVHSVGNGQLAIAAIQRSPVDIVVLDIEMPVMDGLTALPKILAVAPGARVLMASTLTQKNADISLRAMQSGAADYVPKPSSTQISGASDFKRELLAKVKALGGRRRAGAARTAAQSPSPGRIATQPAGPIALRQPSSTVPQVIAIGSSTGGPQALFKVIAELPTHLRQPIFITQHMPPTFTTILAEHIGKIAKRPVAEARDGEAVQAGRIYVAPGDFHMVIDGNAQQRTVRLNKDAPENFCRPSVDPMFRSIAKAYGPAVLAVVLTGMGSDGARGGQSIVAAGGTVIAQDEGTSVVWGMPGAAAAAGICSAVLPLPDIASYVSRLALRG